MYSYYIVRCTDAYSLYYVCVNKTSVDKISMSNYSRIIFHLNRVKIQFFLTIRTNYGIRINYIGTRWYPPKYSV
jgi:hypothetical protein